MEIPSISKRRKTRLNAEIDPALMKRLKHLCTDDEKPIWQVIEEALARHFEAVAAERTASSA